MLSPVGDSTQDLIALICSQFHHRINKQALNSEHRLDFFN